MRLVFAFVAFVAFADSVATSGVVLRVGILSKFFIGNNLLLKLLRTFSLALRIILSYLKKPFFNCFYTFIKIL